MKIKLLSLRIRIFLAMILLILLASILIATVTIFQYKEQNEEYHTSRLERKEENIKKSIHYELTRRTSWALETQNLPYIFKDKIYEISDIHNLEVNMYDLEGNLLISSYKSFEKDTVNQKIEPFILEQIQNNSSHRHVTKDQASNSNLQLSYTYITDHKFKPIGLLRLKYEKDNTAQNKDLKEFLYRLGVVYLFMFLLAIALAYFISSYVTRNIKTVSDKIKQTSFNKRNEKILLKNASNEIMTLVDSYNSMIDQLEDSAVKLAQGEREQAWREMAKQVAHEIKNPLTPMRLTVQSFERKFDPKDPKIKEKLSEYSKTLIHQIDVMSSIASAFSDFAKMPTQKSEKLNVVDVVKHALDIFTEDYISYFYEEEFIEAHLDKTQLIRIVTNLVKNATHAVNEIENKKIEVSIKSENKNIIITVADNGKGINEELKNKVFEPKFTTKSSGMGLGLPMVKNIVEAYNGELSFTSTINKGTVFKVVLPKNKSI